MDQARRTAKAAIIVLATLLGAAGVSSAQARTLVLDLELDDTSGEAPSPAHDERLKQVSEELRRTLNDKGYDVMDAATTARFVPPGTAIRSCNGCENDIARAAGADLVVFGVVHKVSSLVLSILLVVEDVASDRAVTTARTDIRGDTGPSWSRGVAWLAEHRLAEHAPKPRPGNQ